MGIERKGIGDFDIQELDELVKPLVSSLRKVGFMTTGSCQGGDGHAFDLPTICIETSAKDASRDRGRLAEAMVSLGFSGFSVAEVYLYQGCGEPWDTSLELVIWSSDQLDEFSAAASEQKGEHMGPASDNQG